MAKRIFIGEENFAELIASRSVYIDKTWQIRNFFNEDQNGPAAAKVMLFTRPRRFGKTLTMSMLKSFFEINYADPADNSKARNLFAELAIAKDQAFCKKHLGRYPVIAMSLKGIEGNGFQDALEMFLSKIFNLYRKFDFLLASSRLSREEKEAFRYIYNFTNIQNRNWDDPTLFTKAVSVIKNSLVNLTSYLYSEFSLRSVVLVDEYDVPLQKACVGGYYEKMLDAVRGMFENVFKTNDYLEKGVVSGCLRISHESIFTGINNFSVYTVLDPRFSNFIGFTTSEVKALLSEQGLSSRESEVISWYDGYNFGGEEMLCPWSVLNFCDLAKSNGEQIRPQNFWANSSGNDIIEICIKGYDENNSLILQSLLDGKTVEISPQEFASYPDLTSAGDFETMLSLLLNTGYLTAVKQLDDGKITVKIPNREILECFRQKIENIFSKRNSAWLHKGVELKQALFSGDAIKVQDLINDMLLNFVSIRDSAKESFYHAFLSGVLSMTIRSSENLKSDVESGEGYADLMYADEATERVVIIECKKVRAGETLTQICTKALKQINDRRYELPFAEKGYKVQKYGIAFTGKSCKVSKA